MSIHTHYKSSAALAHSRVRDSGTVGPWWTEIGQRGSDFRENFSENWTFDFLIFRPELHSLNNFVDGRLRSWIMSVEDIVQIIILNPEELNLDVWLELGDGHVVMLGMIYRAFPKFPDVGDRVHVKGWTESFTTTDKLLRIFTRAELLAKDHGVDLRSPEPSKDAVGIWMLANREQMN